jgi:signal transduction histidine kinase
VAEDKALTQLRGLVDDLMEAARTGAIIPVRLPGQVEAISDALAGVEEERAAASSNRAANPTDNADMQGFLQEQAEFISVAIHELRIPMTSIRGYSDMLNTPSMGELNDMQKQFLDTIRVNARRMETLLQDVSDISKLRGGTLKVEPKMDMFKNIAMRIEKDLTPVAEETGRELVFDLPQGLPILNTDGERLAQALKKLVENALRYTDDEGGRVVVSASGEDGQLVIAISDNGIGMAPEDQQRLGEIYFRADHERVREFKGSGLGVAIAYRIIDLLGGTVSVESALGEGTTFIIRMPGMS